MREAIGGSWLVTIVIAFILLFTGYLCLSMNVTKAYKVKSEIVKIIERNNGFTNSSCNGNVSCISKDTSTEKLISDYISEVGYATTGSCDSDEVGYPKNSNNSYYYCIKETTKEYQTYVNGQLVIASEGKKYYRVKVFFKIDLPVFNDFFTFGVKGSTKQLDT